MGTIEKNHSQENIIEVLTEAAKQHFKIELITEPLSEEEWQEIQK